MSIEPQLRLTGSHKKERVLLKEFCIAHDYFSPVDKHCVQFLFCQDTSFGHGVIKTLQGNSEEFKKKFSELIWLFLVTLFLCL